MITLECFYANIALSRDTEALIPSSCTGPLPTSKALGNQYLSAFLEKKIRFSNDPVKQNDAIQGYTRCTLI